MIQQVQKQTFTKNMAKRCITWSLQWRTSQSRSERGPTIQHTLRPGVIYFLNQVFIVVYNDLFFFLNALYCAFVIFVFFFRSLSSDDFGNAKSWKSCLEADTRFYQFANRWRTTFVLRVRQQMAHGAQFWSILVLAVM